jgi:phosphohistidine swiveling domain-containing protein
MNGLHYQKAYTRDHGLIIQELWSWSFNQGANNTLGENNPFTPVNVYYVVEGVVEIWHGREAHQWFTRKLLEKVSNDETVFDKWAGEYQSLLSKVEGYKKKQISSIEDLKDFIELFRRGSELFAVIYYPTLSKDFPTKVYNKAKTIREEDSFYDDCEKVIKKALSRIFPKVKENQLVVMIRDLDRELSDNLLEERMNNFVFIPEVNLMETINLEDFLIKHEELIFEFDNVSEDNKKTNIIKGQCVCKGKVKGIVRIIKRVNQVSLFKEREILISPMTTPHFISAMKKAAAIITDEGGITCHAAIIARELKIPCIIGTKIATQFFKDGDLVEVDAEKGVVKKIK